MKLKESDIRNMIKDAEEKYSRTMTIDVYFWKGRTTFKLYVESKADVKAIQEDCNTWNELITAYDTFMQTPKVKEENIDELSYPNS